MSRGTAGDAWRLAVGTLTALPVRPPGRVDRAVALGSVLLAPMAVLPLALAAVVVAGAAHAVGVPALAVGLLVVGTVALGSRALHLDGLADVADGLAASYDRERSLEVMKSGSAGPAGVVALVLVVGVQAVAVAGLTLTWGGVVLLGLAVCVSRAALSLCCLRTVPAARPDGLGRTFAGSLPLVLALFLWLLLGAGLAAACQAVGLPWWRGLAAAAVAGTCVGVLVARAVRRFGGVTGDVFGASIEVAFAALLLTLA